MATVGGAIGSGLEDEKTVRAAAYGFHPDPDSRPDDKDEKDDKDQKDEKDEKHR
jgi:hypothetical protein